LQEHKAVHFEQESSRQGKTLQETEQKV